MQNLTKSVRKTGQIIVMLNKNSGKCMRLKELWILKLNNSFISVYCEDDRDSDSSDSSSSSGEEYMEEVEVAPVMP